MWSLRVRRPRLAAVATRSYWWGHDTVEDKQMRQHLAEERKLIKWTSPGQNLKEKSRFTLSPTRIMDEAAILGGGTLFRFNKADYYEWATKPRLAFFDDPDYYMCDQLKKKYMALVRSQIFLRERFVSLGPDLAAAHFLIYRHCRVRFKGEDHWIEMDE